MNQHKGLLNEYGYCDVMPFDYYKEIALAEANRIEKLIEQNYVPPIPIAPTPFEVRLHNIVLFELYGIKPKINNNQ